MEVFSVQISDAPGGVRLRTMVDDLEISCYVVITEPELERVAEIVPAEVFESGVDVHANAVLSGDHAEEQVLEVIENMNPGDVAVFMCADALAYGETLAALGFDGEPGDERLNN